MTATETVQDFIKRKDEQFRENDKLIAMKDIGRGGRVYFKREAWIFLPQHNLNKKVFVFERLKKVKFDGHLAYSAAWNENDIEYRLGYFIIGRTGTSFNRWVWGQYCALIPHEDLLRLLEKARREKVLLEK